MLPLPCEIIAVFVLVRVTVGTLPAIRSYDRLVMEGRIWQKVVGRDERG